MNHRVVTIDGGSATGKSALGRSLADRLGWVLVESGHLYRAIAYRAAASRVRSDDVEGLLAIARAVDLTVADGRACVDVPRSTASERVANVASRIGLHPEVRLVVNAAVRALMSADRLVVVGRDAGTAIVPEAAAQFFLRADLEARSARRAAQLGWPIERAREAIRKRDGRDELRRASPLRPAARALVIDTYEVSQREVVRQALAHLRVTGVSQLRPQPSRLRPAELRTRVGVWE